MAAIVSVQPVSAAAEDEKSKTKTFSLVGINAAFLFHLLNRFALTLFWELLGVLVSSGSYS